MGFHPALSGGKAKTDLSKRGGVGYDERKRYKGEMLHETICTLICPALFLLFAIAIIWFLHLFVQVDSAMSYITWDSSVCILPDGSEEPFSSDVSSNSTDLSGTYRFTGTLPDMQEAGDLVFETTGLSVTLALDNEVIWQSRADDP